MYLFRGGMDFPHSSSPASQAHLQKWMEWMSRLSKDGLFVAGEPLSKAGKRVSGAHKVVTDGPFAEAKEVVGGYLIVKAHDMEHAVEISKECPIFEVDGHIEVRHIDTISM